MIALGLIFKILTGSLAYFQPVRHATTAVLGPIVQVDPIVRGLYYRIGFFLEMVPILGGLLLIFFISQKSRERLKRWHEVSQILLFIYLVVLIGVIANFTYVIFYLTSVVILSLIILNYYKNYLNTNKNKKTLQVMFSFVSVMIGNIFMVFTVILPGFYVVGEFFMLVGFLTLLAVYMQVLRR